MTTYRQDTAPDLSVATNLCIDPPFEAHRWWSNNAGASIIEDSTVQAHSGDRSCRVEPGMENWGYINGLNLGMQPGNTYSLVVWVWSDTTQELALVDYGAGAVGERVQVPVGVWTPLPLANHAVPAGSFMYISVRDPDRDRTIDPIYTDDLMVVDGAYLPDYFDGDTPDDATHTYAWTGTPYASTSKKYPKSVIGDVWEKTTAGQEGFVSHTWDGQAWIEGLALTRTAALAVNVLTSAEVNNRVAAVAVKAVTLADVDNRTAALAVKVLTVFAPINRGEEKNRVGGRSRGGIGHATWTPAVVIPPGATATQVHTFAHTLPAVDPDTGRVAYTAVRATQPAHLDRLVVGSRDVTYWRGQVTPLPSHALLEPLGYGPATLVLPQVAVPFETPGAGDLRFLRLGAPVIIQRVDLTTGEVVATDYKGVILSHDLSGADLTCNVGGEVTGRAALRERQVPIFTWKKDLGRMAHDAIRGLRLRFDPYLGPVTGITAQRFGGMGFLDYIQQVCAMGWTRAGNRWTVMPDEETGAYRMFRKDTTTIHATAYLDDARTVGALSRDLTEEPNRIYMTGVTPEGLRVRFGGYPGLKFTPPPPYPFTDGRTFGQGTTNAQTSTGDGISVLINRLFIAKYLNREDLGDGYDAEVTRAVKDAQKDAGLSRTGDVNPKTWRVLYDLDSTGYSLRGSRIFPAAQAPEVKPWNLSPSGARISRNPEYDRRVLQVDRNIDVGTGFTRGQMREWARAELEQAVTSNWVGSVTFHTGALISGEHHPGDPLTDDDLLPARALRAGMNLWLPTFDGGTLIHVVSCQISADGTVSVDVDSRARDAPEVWEVIDRNRESRRSLRRAWLREHRSSTGQKDSTAPWDEVGGILGDKVTVKKNQWTVFPVVAGQEGTIARLRVRTNPNAEFVMAVFGRRIYPARLQRMIGNPLTREGSRRWENEAKRDRLDARDVLLYVAGSDRQPLGYWPNDKESLTDENEGDTPPPTGRWQDDAGFPYRCFGASVLWVAVYADRDTSIPQGRIMWPQLEAGT